MSFLTVSCSNSVRYEELNVQIKYDMRNTEATLVRGRFRTDVFKFLFFNRIVNLWNGLPVAIRTIDRVSLFSKKVRIIFIVIDHFLSLRFVYVSFSCILSQALYLK